MVGKVESRRAAFNLISVVVLLLVPIGFFGYFYAREAKNDIAFLEKEIRGIELSQAAIPFVFGENRVPTAEMLARIRMLERDTLEPDRKFRFNDILDLKSQDPAVENSQPRMAQAYIETVIADSGLILDWDEESYFLIVSMLQNIPDVLLDFKQVMEAKITRLQDGNFGVVNQDYRQLLIIYGETLESMERLSVSFDSALHASSDQSAYSGKAEMIEHFEADLEELGKLLVTPSSVAGHSVTNSKARMHHASEEAAKLWSVASDRLLTLIQARHSKLKSTYTLLLVLGIGCALLGLGYALFMFHTKLRKLDEVEGARAAETQARIEAETMSAKLSEVNDDMAKLNKDLNANLIRLKEAQDELLKRGRMEQLGQLTATIAHELRNPLGAVRTSAFLLQRKIAGKGLGVDHQIDRINNGITRCDNTISQLLDFSRTKKIVAKAGNLDQWLAKTVEDVARQIHTSVQIDCVLGLDDREVPFDGARLERAIINLMSNAAEAMIGNGDDAPNATGGAPRITVSTFLSGEYACLRVKDNGPGIPAEQLAKVREPLYTTKSFGTGLGIPAVEQIAVQHDGKLEIESRPNEGAEFTIFLPLSKRMGEAA